MTYSIPPVRPRTSSASSDDASNLLDHNDLDQLKRQAKDLLRALDQRDAGPSNPDPDPVALSLAKTHYRGELPGEFQLADAQLIIARHHGFPSWNQLRAHVDAVNLKRLLAAVKRGDARTAADLLRTRPELARLPVADNNEHRALHFAVLQRDEPMVRVLMKAGAGAHGGIYPHREATTPMVLARERGFAEIVTAIEEEEQFRREDMSCPNATISPEQDVIAAHIREGRQAQAIAALRDAPTLIHACDRDGGTVLHVACQEGALEVIEWLLEQRANPRKPDLRDCTPLERAIHAAHWRARHRTSLIPTVAQRLITHGAPVTPLVAAALGDLDAMREHHRRDPAAFMRPRQWGTGGGPLCVAITFGKPEMVRLLLDLGMDPDQPERVRDVEVEGEEEIWSRGGPLWLASAFAEYDLAQMFIDAGADVNARCYASGTPLDRAYGIHDKRMIAQLMKHGATPSAGTLASYRDVEACAALLASDPPPKEETISSMIWSAACSGSPEIVAMCLERITWAPDDSRWRSIMVQPLRIWLHSPIHDFHDRHDRGTYPECLRLLLAHGISLRLDERFGATLLHNIAALGNTWGIDVMTTEERTSFARITLEESAARVAATGNPGAGVDLAMRDDLLKSTPLGWAARWGRTELVQLLLDHGAPAAEPDAEEWATPLAWARKMGHGEIARLLETRIARPSE